MGAIWGISRTMAEIHALLFISTQSLCTDDLMQILQVSRGNVSMNLRQLLNWGLIHRVHRKGDRKEYFVAESDIWLMFEIIMRERRRREVEPIVETIERCREMLASEDQDGNDEEIRELREYERRLGEMQEFFTVMNTMFNRLVKTGKPGIRTVLKMFAAIGR